jgi:selenocysteine lyase/cysteine desulfurase
MRCLFEYETTLAQRLLEGLAQLPGVRVQGIAAAGALARRVPTVSFTVDRQTPAEIAKALARRGVFVWSGHNYAVEPARWLGIYDHGGVVRVGPVHYNSIEEIDRLLAELAEILPRAHVA